MEAPFEESDKPNCTTPYAHSKKEAEDLLFSHTENSSLEICVIRPPLIYGNYVLGNMKRLIKLVKTGLPLPLGNASNLRSFIGVNNLSSAIEACCIHPNAKGEIFLVSDGHDISTADLIQKIARSLGKSPKLIPVPHALMKLAGTLTRQSKAIDQLFGSLRVNSTKIRSHLNWNPPHSVDTEIDWMVKGY